MQQGISMCENCSVKVFERGKEIVGFYYRLRTLLQINPDTCFEVQKEGLDHLRELEHMRLFVSTEIPIDTSDGVVECFRIKPLCKGHLARGT